MAISAFETLDFLQRVAPCVLARPAGGQEKARTIVCASQLCGHQQGELSGRLLGLRSSNRNKAKGTWPAMWLIAELGRLDIVADGAVAQTPELAFDGSGQARNDYEAHVLRLDPLDERAVVKSLVCSENHAPAWVRRRQ